MIANDGRYLGLLQRLVDLTDRGSLKWKKGSGRLAPEPFSASLTDTTFRIQSLDRDQRPPFQLEIIDKDGFRLESIASVKFSEPSKQTKARTQLEKLYNMARRDALDVDNVINRVILELDEELDKPPF